MTSIEEFIRNVAKGEENCIQVSEKLLEDGGKARTVSLANRKLRDEAPLAPARTNSAPARAS